MEYIPEILGIPKISIQDGPDYFFWDLCGIEFVNQKVYGFGYLDDARTIPNFEELIGNFLGCNIAL
jgi:hypothetical protein